MLRRSRQMSAPTTVAIVVILLFYVNVGMEPQVKCTARSKGGEAELACKISSPMDVVQVTWQKRRGHSYETLVTRSKRLGVKISKAYENRLSVLQTKDPGTSSIALSQLEKEDDACYAAIFNIYPDGSLTGEVCLPKLHGVREVICKSPADFSVILDPPQIKTQRSQPNGTTIQIGRWINGSISPVCNFQPRREERTKRSVPDRDELLTIECKASGTEKPTITWSNEGRPISREEKVNTTGDLMTVTSTLHHAWSTLSEGKGVSCTITYNKDNYGFIGIQDGDDDNVQGEGREKTDLHQERKSEVAIIRGIIPSVSLAVLLLAVLVCALCYFSKRKQLNSPKKYDKAEEGSVTPINSNKHQGLNNAGSPATENKQRKGSAVEKNKENIERNILDPGYTLINTNEVNTPGKSKANAGTPGTRIKQRIGSTVKKNKENMQRNILDAHYTDEVTNGTPRSETEPQNTLSQKKKKKSVKRLFT